MHFTVPSLLLALTIGQAPRECYRTTNFMVYAETAATAKRVGDAAETHRKDLGKLWLGKALADWSSPCRIDVSGGERLGGYTDVSFSQGRVTFQGMKLHGPLERVLVGPLPHELTHVLFAHHFGRRLPRWADEGGAIVSESEAQRAKHRKSFAGMLTEGRQFPLRKFFGMEDYPADIPCFYAQGHSISGYLVAARGHKAFLAFVQTGLDSNWDNAAREQYGYQNVEDMERDWLNYLGRQARMAP